MRFKGLSERSVRFLLGAVAVGGFFLVWEFLLTFVFVFNPFFITKPSLKMPGKLCHGSGLTCIRIHAQRGQKRKPA